MSNIVQAIGAIREGSAFSRASAIATLAMWALMGSVVASAIAAYIPGDSGVLPFIVGGVAGLGVAAIIKAL